MHIFDTTDTTDTTDTAALSDTNAATDPVAVDADVDSRGESEEEVAKGHEESCPEGGVLQAAVHNHLGGK